MNESLPKEKPVDGGARRRAARTTGGVALGQGSSRDARRVAAAVLEVLAGARTPAEAAAALAVTVPRYYQLESQALQGLLAACAAKPKGRQRNPETDLVALRRANERLEREVSRQQALLRAAQRTVGLAAPVAPPASKSAKKPRRRRVARALTVAARLQEQNAAAAPPAEVQNRT
jgi:uncharacterized protein (DUF2267 family)